MYSAGTTFVCGRKSRYGLWALALGAGVLFYAPYGHARCTGFEPSTAGENCRAGYTLRHTDKGGVPSKETDRTARDASAVVASGAQTYGQGSIVGATALPVRDATLPPEASAKDPSANYDGTTCEYFTRAPDATHLNYYPENATVLYGANVYTCTNGLWKYIRAASSYSAKARHRMDAVRIEGAKLKSQ